MTASKKASSPANGGYVSGTYHWVAHSIAVRFSHFAILR